ncbi:MAG: hydroxyisourate hydrolase [Acidobacteriaceae bacterium]
MSLSTHILDTALGRPAANIAITLAQLQHDTWRELVTGHTDADGRCKTLLADHNLEATTYRLTFHTQPYFAVQNITSLYPYIEIIFTITDPAQHYHIPLLLTANGYTTYRGT